MTPRTGLKTLIGLSVLGIGVAIFLIYTCPFAGQLAFSTRVRQVPMQHDAGAATHAAQPGGGAEDAHKEKTGEAKDHAQVTAEHREEHKRFSVHFMMIPGVRSYPIKETKVVGIDVSPLGIVTLLVVIALSVLILRRRTWSLFGYRVTPQTMGLMVFLITVWNVAFAAFLLVVETVQLREL
ncbi:MAG: hypothetical protein ACT4PJ_18100 [Gemmatimonadaceae bacterium]